ncbi:MAG TPA: hypothetical protein VJH03_03995 [Blastocatellia bacterium]|nr:hypothetical protein [Blastocatellia bacterium]
MSQLNTRIVALLLVLPLLPSASPGQSRDQKTIDAILVLVNDDIITRTDLLWSLALDPKAPSPAGAVNSELLRQKLDVMIDERLVAQEAARIPAADVSRDEINAARTTLIAGFGSEAAFRQRVESVGLTSDRIDDLIRRRILIDRFIDFRFKSFVFVSEQDVKRYYDEHLAPELRRAGQIAPPLERVRDRIVPIVKQEKVNEEVDRFLNTIRQRAEIVQLAEP